MQTIGEFYGERILSRTDLVEKELPPPWEDDVRVVRELFGWTVYSGKDIVECRSEEEARYIKVFLDSGMHSVHIPQDDEYLKSIVPELETLKRRIDEIIDFYAAGLRSPKMREQLKRAVLREITEWSDAPKVAKRKKASVPLIRRGLEDEAERTPL